MKQQKIESFKDIGALAAGLRQKLEEKKYILLYAYNGTGKTRLSMAFKDLGKQGEERDTLYFNAFTEDLFIWDNDLENDIVRVLKLNSESRFFAGLKELEMETRIRPLLHCHVDFDFTIDTEKWEIAFFRTKLVNPDNKKPEGEDGFEYNIKVSRGEENIFIWCFFLAIVQLVIDGADAYSWVKYIYIDDPVSSLDDNNVITLASQLAHVIQRSDTVKTIISTHHALFFNVMHNELEAGKSKKTGSYFLSQPRGTANYTLRYTNSTPFFHHVALLTEVYRAGKSGKLYTYHFNMLRCLLEKSASFHGFKNFSSCIKKTDDDPDGVLHARLVNVLSHDGYSLFEPREMLEENKAHFRRILDDFLNRYSFNPELFTENSEEDDAS